MLELPPRAASCLSSVRFHPCDIRLGSVSAFQAKPVTAGASIFAFTAVASLCGRTRFRTRRFKKCCSARTAADKTPGVKPPSRLKVVGSRFVDEEGRIVVPKGINFSGLSKVPLNPNGATHLGGSQFYEHRQVSFVGRPCPIEDLDMHLQRLRDWGFNLLRLLVTWEALEHAGPGVYDDDYISFIRMVCSRAGEYGFRVLIDPHQDCWSRWTGGDGAPGWTLEATSRAKPRVQVGTL